jgi:hypothetical protein
MADADKGGKPEQDGAGGSQDTKMSGAEVIRNAKRQLTDLTGHPADTVSGLARTDDGWQVDVEIVEVERVPSTTDVLATYVVELDGSGELLGYRRVRRYYRNQAGESETGGA